MKVGGMSGTTLRAALAGGACAPTIAGAAAAQTHGGRISAGSLRRAPDVYARQADMNDRSDRGWTVITPRTIGVQLAAKF